MLGGGGLGGSTRLPATLPTHTHGRTHGRTHTYTSHTHETCVQFYYPSSFKSIATAAVPHIYNGYTTDTMDTTDTTETAIKSSDAAL